MTKFNVPCAFGGQASEVAIFIGNPEAKHNPIHFQAKFIQDVRGGVIPQSVLESLEKLQKLSIENGVPFEELCQYALGCIGENNQANSQNSTPLEVKSENTIPQNSDNSLANEETTKENVEQKELENNQIFTPPTECKNNIIEENKILEVSAKQIDNEGEKK